ncbi:hypothetical protein [Gillisia marina]|nr:hypothetical protein [Gillisia marina]
MFAAKVNESLKYKRVIFQKKINRNKSCSMFVELNYYSTFVEQRFNSI